MLIKHMTEGLSYGCFSAVINVRRATLYDWEKKHPKWLESKEIGKEHELLFWEKLGRALATGQVTGSAACYIFNKKNRFNWRDKQDISSEDGSAGIVLKVLDYTTGGKDDNDPAKASANAKPKTKTAK